MPLTEIAFNVDELNPGEGSAQTQQVALLCAAGAAPGLGTLEATFTDLSGNPSVSTDFSVVMVNTIPSSCQYSLSLGDGSIAPASFKGSAILALTENDGTSPPPIQGLFLTIAGLLAQNFFTSFTLNGATFLSSAATYSQSGGNTIWQFPTGTATVPPTGGTFAMNLTG